MQFPAPHPVQEHSASRAGHRDAVARWIHQFGCSIVYLTPLTSLPPWYGSDISLQIFVAIPVKRGDANLKSTSAQEEHFTHLFDVKILEGLHFNHVFLPLASGVFPAGGHSLKA